MVGKRSREIWHPAGVEEHVIGARLAHLPHDRLRDDVARREISERVLADHEAASEHVDEHRAFAAQRLGDQRLLARRAGPEPQHGRVELHELQVGHVSTGTQRERHAVAGRHRRVGRRREHLPEATGREHDRAPESSADAVAAPGTDHVQGDTAGPAVDGLQQVEHEGVLDDLDAFGRLDRGDQRALDLRPGGVAAAWAIRRRK